MKVHLPFAPFLVSRQGRRMLHGFYPIGAALKPFFPNLKQELADCENSLSATEYLAGTALSSFFYFVLMFAAMTVLTVFSPIGDVKRILALAFAGMAGTAVFAYSLLYPRVYLGRAAKEIERNVLYVTRHLMIQTSAGVPLFDAMVSVSKKYGSPLLDYGAASVEFDRITKEVRGGKEMTEALEGSAARINSNSYRRIMWQLANANKAGANMGFVLRQMMSYLAEEQRVSIRDYGSQLSPIAVFYMLTCIIAPTMGTIFLVMITALAGIAVTWLVLGSVLAFMLVMQVFFVGLIRSKRPVVAV